MVAFTDSTSVPVAVADAPLRSWKPNVCGTAKPARLAPLSVFRIVSVPRLESVNVQVTISPGSSRNWALRVVVDPLLGCALEASLQLIAAKSTTDDFEVQVPYSFSTRDFEAKGSVAVDAGYKLLRGAADGKLEAIARVRGGYNALDEVATPLLLGVHVQYNFTPTIAVISGYAGTQQLRISVADDATMAKPVDFGLPIALGYQPTPELYLQVDTKLATINIHDSANTLIGKDTTPAALTVVYNVINALDVQAALATDLSNAPGDSLSFLVGARYYAGQL